MHLFLGENHAMKIFIVFLSALFLFACTHLIDSKEKPQLYEEKLVGEHSVLADCVIHKLQSDGRSFMRVLQFRNQQYLDVDASEIYAFDARYLTNIIPTYSPTNPDAVLIYGNPHPELMPYADRNKSNGSIYAFALMFNKIDSTTVNATLRGEKYLGDIAWKILQNCVASGAKP